MCRCAAAPLRTLWSWQALQLSHCNAVPLPLSSRDQNEDMQCSHYIHQEDRLITVSACFLSLAVSSCAGHWYSALKLEATKEMWSRQVICMCVCVSTMLRYTFRDSMFALCIHMHMWPYVYTYIFFLTSLHVHVLPRVSVCFLLRNISKSTALSQPRMRPPWVGGTAKVESASWSVLSS